MIEGRCRALRWRLLRFGVGCPASRHFPAPSLSRSLFLFLFLVYHPLVIPPLADLRQSTPTLRRSLARHPMPYQNDPKIVRSFYLLISFPRIYPRPRSPRYSPIESGNGGEKNRERKAYGENSVVCSWINGGIPDATSGRYTQGYDAGRPVGWREGGRRKRKAMKPRKAEENIAKRSNGTGSSGSVVFRCTAFNCIPKWLCAKSTRRSSRTLVQPLETRRAGIFAGVNPG